MSEQAHLWPDGYYRTTPPPDPSSQERRLWLEALIAERDRLREALEKIASMPLSESWQQHFFDATEIARAALREADDD